MEFLESLYEIENFGIYLFVIIGILVVLFLVVLFFGKKDQKTKINVDKNLEKTENVKPQEEIAFKEVTEPHPVEIPVAEETFVNNTAVLEPEKKEEVATTANVVLNSFLEPEPQIESPSIEREFDFDALADAISKELETIDKNTGEEQPILVEEVPAMPETVKSPEPVLPPIEENKFQVFEPVKIEPLIEPVVEEKIIMPVEEDKEVIKPRPSMPTVFSSVYVNREKEEIKPSPIPEPVNVEAPMEEIVTPVKPTIDLPKMVDLPKRVEETPIVKPVLEERQEDNIFSNINN